MIKYDSYADSGIEWLGEIPEHWDTKRIKDFATVNSGLSITNSELIDEGFEVYGGNGFMGYTDKYNVENVSIIIGRVGAKCGNVKLINERKWISDNALILKLNENKYSYNYLALLLDVMNLGSLSTSTAQPLVTGTKILNQFILFPPLKEQTAIAQYLDTKTQTIDKKVNLLEKKIGYYKEIRKSIINETVTKGLDKTVRLKDSGIDWIGQIPVHWEVKRLKEIGNIETSSVNKKIEEDEEMVKLVNYIDVYNNPNKEIWNKDDYMQVSAKINQIQNKILRQGDVLFTPSSETIEDIGVSSVVMENLNNTLYSYHLLRLKFREKIYLNFKKYMLNNDFVQYYFSHSSTGTTRKILSLNTFYNLKVVFPPTLKEQTEIATYLDHKTQTIDKIVGNIQNQITTLKELRKTLINDVVTGKIRVFESVENKEVNNE